MSGAGLRVEDRLIPLASPRRTLLRAAAERAGVWLAALAIPFAAGLAGAASSPSPAPSMSFAPCQIQDLQGIAVYAAQCADFAVPENPAKT
ncbi:MAG: hypothetical protein WDO56_32870 [Gammaproteobacteria bacterium]